MDFPLTFYVSSQLQQYRKKKDGRGSKTSGKAGTPEQAVDDDTTAAEVKPIVAKGERLEYDLIVEPVDLSVAHSRENFVACDTLTKSLPLFGACFSRNRHQQNKVATAVKFFSMVSGVHEVGLSSSDGVEQDVDSSLQNETGHSSVGDNTAASGSSLEKWEMVECEGKSPQVGEPKSVDLSGPPDFGAVIEVASEVVMRAHRPDQVPDIGCARILLFSILQLLTCLISSPTSVPPAHLLEALN